MQYTIRGIPDALDASLRARARAENKSLNEVTIQALVRAMGFSKELLRQRDLHELAGSWREDPDFDAAIADQHQLDDGMWK